MTRGARIPFSTAFQPYCYVSESDITRYLVCQRLSQLTGGFVEEVWKDVVGYEEIFQDI